MTSIRIPLSMHARTRRYPGSEIDGIPASVSKATFSPARQSFDQFASPPGFVMLMKTDKRLANLEPLQENRGAPRILGRDDCDLLQDVKRSERDIA